MIQETLDEQAPVQVMQISQKNAKQLSLEARELLAERDNAYQKYKITSDKDDLREFKNLRNSANRAISKD